MKYFLSLFLLSFLFFSCTNDEGVHFQPDTFYLTTTTPTVQENDGTISVSFNTTKSFSNDVSITFELSGSAEATIDYNIPAQNVTLLAGEFSTNITIDLIDDTAIEEQENIILTVTAVSNQNLTIDDSDTITITIIDDESIAFQNGILINNYGNPTGTITYINNDFTTTVQQIYNNVNTESVGNGLQSIGFYDTKAYLIATDNNQVTVVNRNSFLKETTINTTFNNPRYFAALGTKGYVTNWGDPANTTDDFIAVIDLTTNTIETTIAVDEKPEKIIAKNGKIYVAHSGAISNMSIIDASDNSVNTVTFPANLLNDMIIDNNNNIWLLAQGNPASSGTETPGKLITYTIADATYSTIDFSTTEHPNNLAHENGILYYSLNNAVYVLNNTETTLPTTPILSTTTDNIAVNNGKLYATDVADSVTNGFLKIYNLTDYNEIQTINTGIIPSEIYFN